MSNSISIGQAISALTRPLGFEGAIAALRPPLANGTVVSWAKTFAARADWSIHVWPAGNDIQIPAFFWDRDWRNGEWTSDRSAILTAYTANWELGDFSFVETMTRGRTNIIRATGVTLKKPAFARLCRDFGVSGSVRSDYEEAVAWIMAFIEREGRHGIDKVWDAFKDQPEHEGLSRANVCAPALDEAKRRLGFTLQ